jgi:hypothetical protein
MTHDLIYHALGVFQFCSFLFFIFGLFKQIQKIRSRVGGIEEPTAVLSFQYYLASFAAIFGYFLLGSSASEIDYYTVISRFFGILLTLVIIIYITKYRGLLSQKIVSTLIVFTFLFSIYLLLFNRKILENSYLLIWIYSFFALAFLILGQLKQLKFIHASQSSGAISKEARLLNIMKDFSVVLFATYSNPMHNWPVIFCSTFNIILCLLIINAINRYSKIK